jgi:DNA repair exonuclease SbcCD ATPase subunit
VDPKVQALLQGEMTVDIKEQLMKGVLAQQEDLEKNVQLRMEEIQRSKKMSEAEKNKLLDKLEEYEKREREERQKKRQLIEKVSCMEAKILKGNENEREYLELQRELQRQREERQQIKQQRLQLEEEEEEHVLTRQNLEKKYRNQKDELSEKKQLLCRLDSRLEKVQRQYEEVCEQHNQELKTLKEESQMLNQQMLFNAKVIENYFDNETRLRIQEALTFNSRFDSFKLSEMCDVEVKELCQMYSNIKQIQEKNLETEIDTSEENYLLFYGASPFYDFKC